MPSWSVQFLEWTFTMKPRWVALNMMLSLNKTLHITKLMKIVIVMATVCHSHVVRKRYSVCHQCITVKAHYTLHAPLALNPWINSESLMAFEPMTPLTHLSVDQKSAGKRPTVGCQSSNSRLTNDWRSGNSWPTVIWGELSLTIILFSVRKLTLFYLIFRLLVDPWTQNLKKPLNFKFHRKSFPQGMTTYLTSLTQIFI